MSPRSWRPLRDSLPKGHWALALKAENERCWLKWLWIKTGYPKMEPLTHTQMRSWHIALIVCSGRQVVQLVKASNSSCDHVTMKQLSQALLSSDPAASRISSSIKKRSILSSCPLCNFAMLPRIPTCTTRNVSAFAMAGTADPAQGLGKTPGRKHRVGIWFTIQAAWQLGEQRSPSQSSWLTVAALYGSWSQTASEQLSIRSRQKRTASNASGSPYSRARTWAETEGPRT